MEKTPQHLIAILCGGTGPRLWPLSRASLPKQFLSIFSNKTLIQETWERSLKIVPSDCIYIVTNRHFVNEIKRQIPQIDPKHIISEPEKKNTGLALIYLSSIIATDNPHTIITTLPADHHISQIDNFAKTIHTAQNLTEKNQKITLICKKPTSANPSYGYIVGRPPLKSFFNISQFIEKPQGKELEKIFQQGGLWNLGIYTFSPHILLTEIQHTQKKLFSLYNLLFTPKVSTKIVEQVYHQAPNLSIESMVSEVSSNLQALKTNFDWTDVGEWGSIFKFLPKNKNNIKFIGQISPLAQLNSQNCLISASPKKIIGLNGVSDIAVIDTPDALLITKLSDSLKIRDLVGQIVGNKATEKYFLKKNEYHQK